MRRGQGRIDGAEVVLSGGLCSGSTSALVARGHTSVSSNRSANTSASNLTQPKPSVIVRADLHSWNDDTAARVVADGGGMQAVIDGTDLRTRENVLGPQLMP
jgi:hypothetical protein